MKSTVRIFIIFLFISVKSFAYQDKSGTISTTDTWSDTIHVTGDIIINQTGQIIIQPGTYIEFEGLYFIKVTESGKIVANGNASDSVRFTPVSSVTGWNGIKFENMLTTADSSTFNYCIFESSKGAMTLNYFNKIRVSHCSFLNNRPGSSAYGAGIKCMYSTIALDDCLFFNNYANYGGALYFVASHATINSCRFSKNNGYGAGGGIYCDTSYIHINSCLFDGNYNNTTSAGGGIYSRKSDMAIYNSKLLNNYRNAIYAFNSGSKLYIENCIIANNEGITGAGVKCTAVQLKIVNSTIAGNNAGPGTSSGGIYLYYCPNVKIQNSILWNNSGMYRDFYFINSNPYFENCDIQDGNSLNLPALQFINNISSDPRFVNPSVNIGVSSDALTADWSIKSCSPCINAGDSNLYTTVPISDFAGNSRIFNDTLDIGAFEFQGTGIPINGPKTIYVKQNGTGDGSSWTNAMGDIQLAINTPLDCYDYLEVWVAEGMYYPYFSGQVNVRATSFILKNNVRVFGGFAGNESSLSMRNWVQHPTILSGNVGLLNDSLDNVYHVVKAENVSNSSVLDGFIIEGGYANMTNNNNGAGILCSFSNPVLNNLTIRNNYALNQGGGALLYYSDPEISNSVVFNNTSNAYGNGLYLNYSSPVISNTKVISNPKLFYADGGGMYLNYSNPVIVNSVISNNNATTGGGMYCSYSSPEIINSIVANNVGDGAGVYCYFSSFAQIKNSIFRNNIHGNELNHFNKFTTATDSAFTIINSLIQGGNNYSIPSSRYLNNIDGNPRFIAPNQNAGPDPDCINANWDLFPCSVCLNKGDSSLFPDGLSNDMGLNPRVFDDTIDIGPYEYQGYPTGLDPEKIIFVSNNGTGSGNSWADPLGNIQEAIDMSTGCYEKTRIWVTAGTFFPDTTGLYNPRTASFNIRNNTFLYGGFAGNETLLEERDLNVNKTVLCGNIGSQNVSTDNCNSVVTVVKQDSVILDGFTVSNGYNNDYYKFGAAIHGLDSKIRLANMTLSDSYAEYYGAGLYSAGCNIEIENSLIQSNYSEWAGALFFDTSKAEIMNCVFYNNQSDESAPCVYLEESKALIHNCLMANNTGGMTGAISSHVSNCHVSNSTIVNNSDYSNIVGAIETGDTLQITNSIIWNFGFSTNPEIISFDDPNLIRIENSNIMNGSLLNLPSANYINCLENNPLFVNHNTINGVFNGAATSVWSLKSCSPCINAGLNDPLLDTSATDLAGNDRVFDNMTDMGAYEYQDSAICLTVTFVISVNSIPSPDFLVSIDNMNYYPTNAAGICEFTNNSKGDSFFYRIKTNGWIVFSDSVLNLQNDTTIIFISNGLTDLSAENNLNLFPVPAEGLINISCPPSSAIEILDSEGRLMISAFSENGYSTVDVSGLAQGIYFIRTTNKDCVLIKKILKK